MFFWENLWIVILDGIVCRKTFMRLKSEDHTTYIGIYFSSGQTVLLNILKFLSPFKELHILVNRNQPTGTSETLNVQPRYQS